VYNGFVYSLLAYYLFYVLISDYINFYTHYIDIRLHLLTADTMICLKLESCAVTY